MLKTGLLVLAAMILVGVSEAGDGYDISQGTWQDAPRERSNKCPPSSCPWNKVRTKMADGSATMVAHVSQYEHSHPLEEKMRRNQQETDAETRIG